MITVYQIKLANDQINLAAQEAKLNVMLGASNFRISDLRYYTETMKVDTDDLEEAFELTNLWDQPARVTRFGSGQSSTSVGDIFQKGERFYMVDSFGFAFLTLFNDEVEMLQAA